ncbi:MAG: sigma-54-dependent Fis family transcriptional regulator [Gammaproteobacteria bacterium]|jgi:two-component system, NtrC family, nitrogen regulation response regulator NtrX|nr:sigma-54-dependent Fis family transcriptional regulator [Gammaproteobacteria bacterium]NBP07513.1 sigma-54-dependent Fis family transcriptional regulator [Gammaproteobacteria bacterium]NBR16612.1 sigma-54-dependent Fis family transcriptional regulator [Gammaproteobacteria bacterium]NCW20856.1 sigma-54-dependent Fis family transcriptional regulator [Gammaproteobacteria bacterium]NCW56909.1 sigma-54-dependent Fis family transcriptional regulator [Gammaproteobacteria bacterium]
MSAASILVVDDEADIRGLVKEILSEEGYEVEVASNGAEARSLRQRQQPDLILLDIWMPDVDGITLLREWSATAQDGCPVVMMSGHGTVETAVEATRLGAVDFVEKPLSIAKLLRTVERGLEGARSRRAAGRLLAAGTAIPVGKSRQMQQLRNELTRVAAGNGSVLLQGEHGSGREAFARFLHDHSPRAAKPFVVMVASALRESDAEEVLFGRAGDEAAAGLLEQAGDGTLFINELGDLPTAAQRCLQGVLESGSFMRLGETKARPLRARIVSSAQPEIELGSGNGVRRDLFAHLNVAVVRVPPLREYAEDVPDLLRHYVDRLVDAEGLKFRRFGVAAQNRLRNYPWPGNVQELRSMVRRLLAQAGNEEITLEEIERELAQAAPPGETLVKQDLLALGLREAREHFERAYLQQQLLLCHGKVGQLAKRVGMERTHLYRKLRALGVDFRSVADDGDA